MKSHEAMQRSIAGKTVEHAKKLHLSTPMINKWQEPSIDFNDSGAFNPLDRIETIIETSLSLGVSNEEATAPIQYLAERFGKIVINLPEIISKTEDLPHELLKTISEFGDLSRESATTMKAGGVIKPQAAKRIEKEAWELIRQVSVFLQKVNAASK
jgi:hypothetical protein